MRVKFSSAEAAVVAAVLAACACSPAVNSTRLPPQPSTVATTAETPRPPNDGLARLSREVEPLKYELSFWLDPEATSYTGSTVISLNAQVPTTELKLHAEGLKISKVVVSAAGEDYQATPRNGTNGGLSVDLERPFSGHARVAFEYTAELSENPMSLYRVQEKGQWYVFSQFQPLAARAAFPCFDEPQFKTPFTTHIWVPKGQVAVSNGPLVSAAPAADGAGRMWTRHDFAETLPLPTYLVALAAGDLELSPSAAEPLPFRTITTTGKSRLSAYANQHTPAIIDYQLKYLATDYPYQKLDLVGVPNFRAGAMENAGLMTFRESILLLASDATRHQQIRSRSVIAHEVAHMWFGGLVTMQWWDDIWLNEAFATWLANKSLQATWPEVSAELHAVQSMHGVMDYDLLSSSEPIQKTIRDAGDIKNAFDYVTYVKGAAVLRMLDSWLGAETLRAGLQRYLKKNAWGNTKLFHLSEALSEVTEAPVSEVLRTFVTQAGIPEVDVRWQCEEKAAGKHTSKSPAGPGATLSLAQRRSRLTGVPGNSEERWTIPVCMKLLRGAQATKHCITLSKQRQSFALPHCPEAIYPNADEHAYYRFQLPPSQLVALATKHRAALTEAERMALPAHAWSAFEAQQLTLPELLSVVEAGLKAPERLPLEVALTQLTKIARLVSDASALSPRLARWGRAVLSRQSRRVGLLAKRGESFDNATLRPTLFSVLGLTFRSPSVERQAAARAKSFVADVGSVSEDELRLFLPIATRPGGEPLHASLVGLVGGGLSPTAREVVVLSLGGFEEPKLFEQSFELLFSGQLRLQDYGTLVRGASTSDRLRENLWRFVSGSESRLIEYLGPRTAHVIPGAAGGACDDVRLARLKESFSEVARFGDGAQKIARLTLESVERCALLRARHAGSLDAALSARGY